MKHSATATSVSLPVGMEAILDKLVEDLNISKTQFVREAIIEKIEDYLDIKAIEDVLARNEEVYSMQEVKSMLNVKN